MKKLTIEGPLFDSHCKQAHYVAIVDAVKEDEVYQHGDEDCPTCLRRMLEKHQALVKIFQEKLSAMTRLCRVYDAYCINPSYCNARDACCAGDPDCRAEVGWSR